MEFGVQMDLLSVQVDEDFNYWVIFVWSFHFLISLFCQMVELDEATLIQMSVSSEVARKILHYLKQTLQASCLGDLLCSHAFAKHYLRRGGASLEDEEVFTDSSLNSSGLGGQGASSSSSVTPKASTSASSFSINGSVSKKPKKEIPVDNGSCNSDTESELPVEDETKYPEDLEEKMKCELHL